MKKIYKDNEADLKTQETEKKRSVDLGRCTEEEFWQEVKYSGTDSHSQR